MAHGKNLHDGDTLPEVLDQAEMITDQRPAKAIVDRGYRGRNEKQRFLFVLNHNNNPARVLLGKQTGCELLSGGNAKISPTLPQHRVAVIELCQS